MKGARMPIAVATGPEARAIQRLYRNYHWLTKELFINMFNNREIRYFEKDMDHIKVGRFPGKLIRMWLSGIENPRPQDE